MTSALFLVGQAASPENLAITEINYNPHAATAAEEAALPGVADSDFEFIEIANYSSGRIDLTGLKFVGGIDFAFPFGSHLQPGERAVVVRDPDAFEIRYGTGINVLGMFSGGLNNAGDDLELFDLRGETLHAFWYDDENGWPARADGSGSTLELIDPASDPAVAGNWRPSAEYGGSPGAAGAGPVVDVVVNEVLAAPVSGESDAIELHNTRGFAIDVSHWLISDSEDDYPKYQIPPNDPTGTEHHSRRRIRGVLGWRAGIRTQRCQRGKRVAARGRRGG